MTEMTLTASVRKGTGKGVTRKLRRAGVVPGVIYGLEDPLAIQCDARDALLVVQTLHGSERLISLRLSDGEGNEGKSKQVLLKEVQTTPVGDKLLHIDFHEVDVRQTVQVSVEVHPDGKGAGEKMGGILQQVTHEVVIECLPAIIPEFLSAGVSGLEIGHSLHVNDLVLPEGITAITPGEETLFVMAAPRVEEELVEEVAEGVEEALAVEAAEEAEEASEE